jgi:hypothetical protein
MLLQRVGLRVRGLAAQDAEQVLHRHDRLALNALLNLSRQPQAVWREILGPKTRSQFLTHEQCSRRHLLIGLKAWIVRVFSLSCVQHFTSRTALDNALC